MKLKIDPDAIYVSWQGVSSGEYTVPAGTRLRGDHPLVRAVGAAAFVPDGTPPSEWPNPIDDVVRASDTAAKKQKPPPSNPLLDRPLRDFRRCTRGVFRPDGAWRFDPGDVVAVDHEAVRLAPEAFGDLLPRG